MSSAIGRSLRPLWRWRSCRPPLYIRRDRFLAFRGSGAYYAQRSPGEIVLFLRRYGRNGMVTWMNKSMPTSSEQFRLGISTALSEAPTPWNIANAVTVGRIAVTPLIGSWIISGQYHLALAGLVYAAVSDALDGILARRLNLRTVLGSYLDPVADKLLISTTSACLAVKGVIPVELVVLMIGRDLGLVGGWLWHSYRRTVTNERSGVAQIAHIEPLFVSKVNTAMQIGLGFTGVLHGADLGIVNEQMLETIVCATALTTTASGVSYVKKFWKMQSG